MKIEVIGPGCARCKTTEKRVQKALETLGDSVDAEVEKVETQMEIIDRGVMHTPAVAVDGDIVTEGDIPEIDTLVDVFQTS